MRKLINAFVVGAGLLLTANVANAQQKLAHLNSAIIIEAMPEVKTARATLETFQKTKQADIEKMITEYQTKLKAAQDKEKTMSEANKEAVGKELQVMGGELQDLEKRITDARTKAQQELEAKNAELFNPIQVKADAAIKAVSKEKGFAYVFDTANQALIYWDGGDDITDAVKTKLGIAKTAAPAPKK
jgi:outer membrane protein